MEIPDGMRVQASPPRSDLENGGNKAQYFIFSFGAISLVFFLLFPRFRGPTGKGNVVIVL